MEIKKYGTTIIIVLFLCACVWIVFDFYSESKLKADNNINEKINNATINGYNQAIIDLLSEITQCNEIPFPIGNITITIVAKECLEDNLK